MYGNLSEEDKRKLNELLSMTTMRSDGENLDIYTGEPPPVISNLLQPQSAVQPPMPRNYIQSSSGNVIDLDYAAPGGSRPGDISPVTGAPLQHNVWADGPQETARYAMPDGRTEVYKRVPTYDGDGRQTSVIQRFVETPNYLNPAKIKELEYRKKLAELQPKAPDANWKEVESGGKLYLINAKTGEMKPAAIGGEQLVGKQTDAAAKKAVQMEGIGDVIGQAREVLSGTAPGQKSLPTGSGVGSMWDALAAQVGSTPAGATEAQRLKVLGGALTSKMPRMEGPQSDKDTQLYREMAGLVGDDTVPVARRLEALNQVERLWAKYEKPAASSTTGYDPDKEARYQAWKKARGF